MDIIPVSALPTFCGKGNEGKTVMCCAGSIGCISIQSLLNTMSSYGTCALILTLDYCLIKIGTALMVLKPLFVKITEVLRVSEIS